MALRPCSSYSEGLRHYQEKLLFHLFDQRPTIGDPSGLKSDAMGGVCASLLYAVDRGCQRRGPGKAKGMRLITLWLSVWMMQAATLAGFVAFRGIEASLWHRNGL